VIDTIPNLPAAAVAAAIKSVANMELSIVVAAVGFNQQ
jgi:hypothetical protein